MSVKQISRRAKVIFAAAMISIVALFAIAFMYFFQNHPFNDIAPEVYFTRLGKDFETVADYAQTQEEHSRPNYRSWFLQDSHQIRYEYLETNEELVFSRSYVDKEIHIENVRRSAENIIANNFSLQQEHVTNHVTARKQTEVSNRLCTDAKVLEFLDTTTASSRFSQEDWSQLDGRWVYKTFTVPTCID